MKIEIFQVDNLTEKTTGLECFEAPRSIAAKLHEYDHLTHSVFGICIIDNIPVKFYFSPIGLDGDIFTDDHEHRIIIKHLIPIWCLEKFRTIGPF
jgi:hypothetical protein